MSILENLNVAVVSGVDHYPSVAPFDPPQHYPECPFPSRPVDESNQVYPMVREGLRLLGLDAARFGTSEWNPLGEIVRPGNQVLIKPNFVLHWNAGKGPLEAVVTHASVLRAIADYVIVALKNDGALVIGDSPQMNCDLSILCARNGMAGLARFLSDVCVSQNIRFSLVDFREEQTFYRAGVVWKRKPLPRPPNASVPVTLGPESYMETIDSSRLYGADYDRSQTVGAHQNHKHEYRVAQEVLASDVVISVPKLKVHSKVGTTLNIKNMVGINTDKNHLAHYRIGPQSQGGDEFANPRWDDICERVLSDNLLGPHWNIGKYPFLLWRIFRKLWRLLVPARKGTFAYGNWHGNDTAWRMALDLNRILLTTDVQGRIQPTPVRRYFSVIDGIVGGDGDGPLHPDAFSSRLIILGFNPLAVDWIGTLMMGFDPARIPMYKNAIEQMSSWADCRPETITVRSNVSDYENLLCNPEVAFRFSSAPGWRETIETYDANSVRHHPKEQFSHNALQ